MNYLDHQILALVNICHVMKHESGKPEHMKFDQQGNTEVTACKRWSARSKQVEGQEICSPKLDHWCDPTPFERLPQSPPPLNSCSPILGWIFIGKSQNLILFWLLHNFEEFQALFSWLERQPPNSRLLQEIQSLEVLLKYHSRNINESSWEEGKQQQLSKKQKWNNYSLNPTGWRGT